MRILIVVPRQSHITGNWLSAQRLAAGLEERGHKITLLETALVPEDDFRATLTASAPDVVLLLHAYRSGRPWLESTTDLNIPYVVLLTGTDVNHGLDTTEQSAVIHKVMRQAAFVLHQNPLLADILTARHPELTEALRELPAGISVGKSPYALRKEHQLPADQALFLCPAGLRPVKGVLELLAKFDLVAAQSESFHLAFCGPVLDADYAERFLQQIESRSWASYLGTIPAEAMAAAMQSADVIVNNSVSEGLSNALLEAAVLGIPILAHDIPGNKLTVQHGVNGYLFHDDKDFTEYALRYITDQKTREELSNPDPTSYNPRHEADRLEALLIEAANQQS